MGTSRLTQFCHAHLPNWARARKNPVIGLGIGSEAIAFVELGNRPGRPVVKRWGYQPLELQTLEHGKITDRSTLVKGLRSLVEQYQLQGASVAMAVSGTSVMVKRIQVPRAYQRNLEEYLMWESAQYIPYDPDDVYLDFSLCSSASSEPPEEVIDLLLAAAKRETVDERRDLLEDVNLHPVICDVETLAILNLAGMNKEVRAHHSYLMVNIQDAMMNVAVVGQGEPVLVRDVSVTSALSPTFAPGEFRDTSQLDRSNDPDIYDALEPALSEKMNWFEIISELKRTVEGAREIQPALHLERIFLSGPLASSLEFQEEISQSLKLPVSSINPLAFFEWSDSGAAVPPVGSLASIAGGMALRIQHG
jgi:type IV pilus assembly protein PilM